MTEATLFLLVAGTGAGLVGSVASMASLVSYPALLAYGLPPVAANITNACALTGTTVGAAAASRAELRGRGRELVPLIVQMTAGGLAGAALLLATPAGAFAALAPWLVALGAMLLLGQEHMRRLVVWLRRRSIRGRGFSPWGIIAILIGAYTGYFGAGAGIMLLAALAVRRIEPLVVTNAIKNVGTGVANATAAITYLFVAPVDVPAAIALGAGALIGSWIGQHLVRVLPERPLRHAIGIAGLALAAGLAMN